MFHRLSESLWVDGCSCIIIRGHLRRGGHRQVLAQSDYLSGEGARVRQKQSQDTGYTPQTEHTRVPNIRDPWLYSEHSDNIAERPRATTEQRAKLSFPRLPVRVLSGKCRRLYSCKPPTLAAFRIEQ